MAFLAAILGMILGTAGFTVSLMTYLRDRPKIRLKLQWDMMDTSTKKLMGLVRVTNIGRRPIFVSVVALELPKGHSHSHLILNSSMPGTKLSEGDKPMAHLINYEELAEYSNEWRVIRAYAEDSTGRRYFSERPAENAKVPSWVRA